MPLTGSAETASVGNTLLVGLAEHLSQNLCPWKSAAADLEAGCVTSILCQHENPQAPTDFMDLPD